MRFVMFAAAAALLLLVVPVRAADPTGAILWTGADYHRLEKSLIPKLDKTKGASEQLLTQKTHGALVFHREGNAEAEIHEKLADFMVVLNGEGTIQVGGTLKGGRPTAANEIRGDSLEGGTKYKINSGDVLYIPANVPHRTLVEAGRHLNVMVIKVQP